jgi:NAD-dependent deacetylase
MTCAAGLVPNFLGTDLDNLKAGQMNNKTVATMDTSLLVARVQNILNKGNVLCIVGDGLSREARATHFHDIVQGVWSRLTRTSRINPFVTPSHYRLVMGWFHWRKACIAHLATEGPFMALRRLQQEVPMTIATQCADGLIRRAGIEGLELYGNVFEARCYANGHFFPTSPESEVDDEGRAVCPDCGSLLFPNVSMFGWNAPEKVRKEAAAHLASANSLILVGTDSLIAPFSDLPPRRSSLGCPVIEILAGTVAVTENSVRQRITGDDLRKHHGVRQDSAEIKTIEATLNALSRTISPTER